MSSRWRRACGTLLSVSLLAVLPACHGEGPRPHRGLESLWRQFQQLQPARALALAGDPERIWVAGAAGGQETEAEARALALKECGARRHERRILAPCRIYAVGSEIVW